MKISKIVAGCLLAAGVGGTNGCSEAAARVLPPAPVVVAQSGDDGLIGLDYVVTVSCAVRNKGGNGPVRVTATFVQNATSSQAQTIYLAAGDQRDVRFTFREAKALSFRAKRYACSAS